MMQHLNGGLLIHMNVLLACVPVRNFKSNTTDAVKMQSFNSSKIETCIKISEKPTQ